MLNFEHIKADRWLSCFLAVDAAKSCIHIWYPNDDRPNKAIEAAEAWLSNPCKETVDAAYAAANAAYATANAAVNAAVYANAVYAVYAAAANAAAYDAAYWASRALNIDEEDYIHNLLYKYLSFIIDYKVEKNQSFGSFEAVFEAASEKDKEKLLFHLNLSSNNKD